MCIYLYIYMCIVVINIYIYIHIFHIYVRHITYTYEVLTSGMGVDAGVRSNLCT